MAINNEDIVSLHDQAQQLMAEIDKIITRSNEIQETSKTLSEIKDKMVEFIGEVAKLVFQAQKIITELGKLDSAGMNESLIRIKSQCEQLVNDSGRIQSSLGQVAASLEGKQKELLSSLEVLGGKLDNLKASLDKRIIELAKRIEEGHAQTISEIEDVQKAIINNLAKVDKSLCAKLADLSGKQNEFRLGMEKKLKLIRYTTWGGLLLIIILQGLSLFLAYYR